MSVTKDYNKVYFEREEEIRKEVEEFKHEIYTLSLAAKEALGSLVERVIRLEKGW